MRVLTAIVGGTLFAASIASAATFRLAWDAPATGPTPDGYAMFRKVNGGQYTEIARMTEQVYDDTTAPLGEVCWVVKATLGPEISDPSNEVCKTHVPDRPGSPRNLRVLMP